MGVYLLRRLVVSIAAAWVVLTVTFMLIHALPGGPFGPRILPLARAVLGAKAGLNRPLWSQYLVFMAHLARGQLGQSIPDGVPVRTLLAETLPVSASLAALALVWGLPVGLATGFWVGWREHVSGSDPVSSAMGLLGSLVVSVPAFVVAVVGDWLLGLHWHLLPLSGWGTARDLVLPVLSLGLFPMGAAFRLVRAETRTACTQPWWVAVQARGLGSSMRTRYLLRSSLRPLLAVLPILGAGLLTGTLVVEPIFGIPGLGSAMLSAIGHDDTPVVLGGVLAVIATYLALSLLVDLVLALLDPRTSPWRTGEVDRRVRLRPSSPGRRPIPDGAVAIRRFLAHDLPRAKAPPVRAIRRRIGSRTQRWALLLLVSLVFGCVCVLWLDPFPYWQQNLLAGNLGPSWAHWLGTDALGRDLLARLAAGALVSLGVATFSALLDVLVGVPVGMLLGWYTDRNGIGSAVLDLLSSVPMLLIALGLLALFGPGLPALVGALAVGGWLPMARVARAETDAIRRRGFVQALRGLGLPTVSIWWRHVLPHLIDPIVANVGLTVPGAVFAEAVLSFWGIGVQPPLPSLGRLIADGYQVLSLYPRETLLPLLVVVWIVWGFQLLVDSRVPRAGAGGAGR